MEGDLERGEIERLRRGFDANRAYRLAQNAVTRTSVGEVAIDHQLASRIGRSFSTHLDDWKVTNQKQSGRCWLFAGLNLLRVPARQAMGLKQFEFSQCFAMFWDKLERANYFLEAIIATRERDLDDRTVAYLLEELGDDGGQWNMFVALVAKHGLVPQDVMPETESSSNSARLNSVLRSVLRRGASTIRGASGESEEALRAHKQEILEVVFRVLAIHLGTPPERFDWQWTDQDRNFHRDGELTPPEFASRYLKLRLEDYVCLVDDPRPSSPRGRTFTVEYLGNVVGAPPVKYLNVEVDLMRQVARASLEAGEPVWFGCDVSKQMHRKQGLWDAHLYDLDALYGTCFDLDKAERLLYHESAMTHAMLFTGVDVAEGAVRRWRVENSWGDESGESGFFTMNDSWFDQYVFEIAARREALPAALQRAAETEPIVLPAWDPMGSLAHEGGD